MTRKAARKLNVGSVLRFLILATALAFVLFPLYWVAVLSIKPPADYFSSPPVWFPSEPTLAHFRSLGSLRGWTGLTNSIVVAVSTTVLAVPIGALAAYSIARFGTGGRHLSFWIISQRMMPPVAVVIPVFLIYRNIGLLDTQIALTLLYTVFALPFTVWMMYGYFRQMPIEIEEAALVDGCSHFQVLRKISVPIARPAIASAAVFSFIFAWTEFLFALVLTRTEAVTLPLVISGFVGLQGGLLGAVGALTMVALVPALTLGLLVQRHLVRGLTLGAVER